MSADSALRAVAVTHSCPHRAERMGVRTQVSGTGVVLVSGQDLVQRRLGGGREFADGSFGEPVGAHIQNPHPGSGRAGRVREVLTEQLVAGADRQDGGTALSGTLERSVAAQRIGGGGLGAVLATAEHIQVAGLRNRFAGAHGDNLDLDAVQPSTVTQGHDVAAVAVGAQQRGVDADQGDAHRCSSAVVRRWWNAVYVAAQSTTSSSRIPGGRSASGAYGFSMTT